MTQGTSGLVVPATTRRTSLRVDRDRDRCLDPVQRVVREQRQVVPRVGGHHLIAFRQNVDGARAVGHDLSDQPRLKRRDDPLISSVHHDNGRLPFIIFTFGDRLQEVRETNVVRVVGGLRELPSTPAATIVIAMAIAPIAATIATALTTITAATLVGLSRRVPVLLTPGSHCSNSQA